MTNEEKALNEWLEKPNHDVDENYPAAWIGHAIMAVFIALILGAGWMLSK